jgi:hypothetical protein
LKQEIDQFISCFIKRFLGILESDKNSQEAKVNALT